LLLNLVIFEKLATTQ